MNIAIIAAAGQGTRMDGRRAKQFLELAGTPIIIHTLRRFEQCPAIQEIVVVLPATDADGFLAFVDQNEFQKPMRVAIGGSTRAESVWQGLQSVPNTAEIIAVHDGVRPFVTPLEITRTMDAAEEFGAAILVSPATDTIKETRDGKIVRTLDRSSLRRALTPQCFRYDLLLRAFEQAPDHGKNSTDCSALVEQLGQSVAIVEGHSRNIKITRPEDIAYGEILVRQEPEFRIQNPE